MAENANKKYYQTELPSYPKPATGKATEKVDHVLYMAAVADASDRDANEKDTTIGSSKHPSFSFERDKLQHLKIGPSYQTDVNDDRIQKLKDEILSKIQHAKAFYERYITAIKIVGMIMIAFNCLEIVIDIFMLLILVLQYIPADQIFIWVGSSIALSLIHLFMSLKATSYSPNKDVGTAADFFCCSVVLLIVTVIASVVFSVLAVKVPSMSELTVDQRSKLLFCRAILVMGIVLKIVSQSVFVNLARLVKLQIEEIPVGERTNDTRNNFD